MSRLLKIALGLFAAALVCYLSLGLGEMGPYGPGTPIMFLPFIGTLILFPISVTMLLICGARQIYYFCRERSAVATPKNH